MLKATSRQNSKGFSSYVSCLMSYSNIRSAGDAIASVAITDSEEASINQNASSSSWIETVQTQAEIISVVQNQAVVQLISPYI